ncbi:unnamed protein product [Ascophyllum nodosum]
MEGSARSAVDVLLERHRSSLLTGTTAAAASPEPDRPDQPTAPLSAAGQETGKAPFPQHGAGVPEDIVGHETQGKGVDLYDALEFRLRSNDRDLQRILSRSAERLATRERQSPPTPPPTQFAAETASSATTPPAPTAPACIPQLAPVPVPMPRTAGAAEEEDAFVLGRGSGGGGSGDTVHASRSVRTPRTPPDNSPGGGLEATAGVVDALAVPIGTPAEGGAVTAAVENAAFGVVQATAQERLDAVINNHGQLSAGAADPSPGVAVPSPPAVDESSGSETSGSVHGGAVTPQRPRVGEPCRRTNGGESSGLNAGGHMANPPSRPPRGDVGGSRRGNPSGASSTEAFVASGRMLNGNNVEGMLGTPPRLPRPLADGMIVGAAKEAARWLAVDDRTWHQAKKFMDDCMADCPSERILNRRKLTPDQWQESKVAAIEAALRADPSLATSRHINRSAFPMDGWTPLHAAAARGNLEFVKALLKVPGVSVWSVDLQGRTALALAAEGGHLELCLLLKERMEAESADTIVGINAPIDLAGMTPLAWSVRSRMRNKQVESHLYATGDASVCPATPAALRSGGAKTVKGGTARTGAGRAAAESVGEGLPCGYSEAPGWRIEMEDAICIHNPIPPNPEAREAPPADPTSMFGIFDGHGGAFTSKYVAGALVGCLQATPGWKSGDRGLSKLCPAMSEAFVGCDALLAKEPRMVVTERENPSDGKRFEARDGSGSTAVVAFVTPLHVIIANAGDSRAVLIMATSGAGGKGVGSSGSESGSGSESRALEKGKSETASAATSADGAGRCDSVRLEAEAEDKDGEFEGMGKILAALGAMKLRDDAGGGKAVEVSGSGRADVDGSGRVVEATAMSRDHTAKDERERERVTAAGGKAFEVKYRGEDGTESMVVRTAYDGKVEGQSVMPTRGFGDLYYKQRKDADGNLLPPAEQVVTVCPEIMVHERGSSGTEELLLLACDGVWDVFDNQGAGEYLISRLEDPLAEVNGEDLARACDALVAECLRRGSTDNITAMAVSLGSGPPPTPSAIGGRMLFGDGQ